MPYMGWNPDSARRSRARVLASGLYAIVLAPAKAPRPAVSLSKYKLRDMEQGQSGQCWDHSPVALFEITANALGFSPFEASRLAIGYAAKQMFEGGGSPGDGGSPTDAISVMTSQGIGIPPESLCPYSDDPQVVATKPEARVYEAGARTHLMAPVHVRSFDEIVTLVDGNHPVCNGFPCPAELQQQGLTFITKATRPLGGHSVLIIGYAMPGILDSTKWRWLQLLNWWGRHIYRPLPPALAAKIDGYAPSSPSATSDCWIREDAYLAYCRMDGGRAEHISATGVDGLKGGLVAPVVAGADFNDALF